MSDRVTGTFDVKMTPEAAEARLEGTSLARILLEKRFHGPLEATSVGVMISAGTPVKGSAAYSALERVTGRLDGREGAFTLQHTGVMSQGDGHLRVTVVPDSGDGALTGLAGTMAIRIEGGVHYYDLDYILPAHP